MNKKQIVLTIRILSLIIVSLFLASCGSSSSAFPDVGAATVIDGSGNIVVVGYSWNGGNYDMTIWRYDPSGALDSTFGTNGIVTNDNAAGGSPGNDQAFGVVLDGTDIVVVGDSYNGTNLDMAIWRYDNTGNLVTSFNTTGIVTNDNAAGATTPGDDVAYGVALDGTDILVTGGSWNGNNFDMTVWRYSNSGALVTTFNSGGSTPGIVVHDNAAGGTAGNDFGRGIALDGTDIIVAGDSYNGTNLDMAIWRYDNTGALVTSFNSGGTTPGIVTHDNAAGASTAGDDSGLAVTLDGTDIIVAGDSWNGTNYDMTIWRYSNTGALVTTFNSTGATPGIVVHDNAAGGTAGNDYGRGIALDGTDIVIVGDSYNGSNQDMAIWRYNSAGTLATTFNSTGIVTNNNAAGGNGADSSRGVVIDVSSNVVVAGNSYNGNDLDMALWRYTSSGVLDTTFNSTGIVVSNGAAR